MDTGCHPRARHDALPIVIIGRPTRRISEIIAGKRTITPETAIQLGDSLGTGPELWMNLESQYQLSQVRPNDGLVARRARLYARFPVREMIKRGWIEATKSIDVLEPQLMALFGIQARDAQTRFIPARNTAAPAGTPTHPQRAMR